jgi:transcriptional regulator of heat shock response
MKIYVAHSKAFDYKKELYEPIRQSSLNEEHSIVLPHENSDEQFNSKECLRDGCDLVIAEVSNSSTGIGIELGWANMFNVPIVGIHRTGSKPARSLKVITPKFVEYSNSEELISGIKQMINQIENP